MVSGSAPALPPHSGANQLSGQLLPAIPPARLSLLSAPSSSFWRAFPWSLCEPQQSKQQHRQSRLNVKQIIKVMLSNLCYIDMLLAQTPKAQRNETGLQRELPLSAGQPPASRGFRLSPRNRLARPSFLTACPPRAAGQLRRQTGRGLRNRVPCFCDCSAPTRRPPAASGSAITRGR